jgi:hypothetical protein
MRNTAAKSRRCFREPESVDEYANCSITCTVPAKPSGAEQMNRLYFGDNLSWLRNAKEFPDASVDLVNQSAFSRSIIAELKPSRASFA